MPRYRLFYLIIPFLAAIAAGPAAAQTGFGAVITTPRSGDVLQGAVTVSGSSDVQDFLSSEIDFAYAADTTGTWFLVAASNQPISAGTLAAWDTTTITDGDYILRLRVYLTDGSYRETLVTGLRVRNYTPVETPTPAPVATQATTTPTTTQTATPFPTPTSLPPNPAALAPTDVSASILYGGLAAILTFVIIGIYLWLRRK